MQDGHEGPPVAVDIVVGALICALFVATCALGAVPTVRYGHDLFLAFDAGWRVICGQRPHVDFYSPLGAAVPLLVGFGIRLAHETASGIGVASAIAGLICSLMGYGIARRTLQPLMAGFFAIFVFLLTVTPVPLGEPSAHFFSNAMFYTRWSFGLLAVVLIECLSADENGFRDGVSSGAACALLFFVKFNMFLLRVGFIVPSLLFAYRKDRAKGILLGAMTILLAMMLYLKFHLFSIWHDYRIIVKSKSALTSVFSIYHIAEGFAIVLFLLVILGSLLSISDKQSMACVYLPLMAVAVFLADILALATNWQKSGIPLSGVFALFCAARIAKLEALTANRKLLQLAAVTVSCALFMVTMGRDAASYYFACRVKFNSQIEPLTRFSTPSLHDYAVFGGPNVDGRPVDGPYLVSKVNDGISLLSKYSDARESVAVFDYVNPFSFGLKRPPNPGGTSYLVYNNDFNDTYKPSPEGILGTADIVMVPKASNLPADHFEALMRNYGPYLETHFIPVVESEQWVMWRNTTHLERGSQAE